jgi:phenylacetate-CoA oxygenase PaaJ subunit
MANVTLTEDQIIAALKEVDDPEMPISIVDMGMVYGVELQDDVTKVQLGLTATACPAIDFIFMDIKDRLKQEGCDHVDIELVWDPPWTKDRISEEGRFILTTWGLSV